MRGPRITSKEPVIVKSHTPLSSLVRKLIKMRDRPERPAITFIKIHSSAFCPLLTASAYSIRLVNMMKMNMMAHKSHNTGAQMPSAGKALTPGGPGAPTY